VRKTTLEREFNFERKINFKLKINQLDLKMTKYHLYLDEKALHILGSAQQVMEVCIRICKSIMEYFIECFFNNHPIIQKDFMQKWDHLNWNLWETYRLSPSEGISAYPTKNYLFMIGSKTRRTNIRAAEVINLNKASLKNICPLLLIDIMAFVILQSSDGVKNTFARKNPTLLGFIEKSKTAFKVMYYDMIDKIADNAEPETEFYQVSFIIMDFETGEEPYEIDGVLNNPIDLTRSLQVQCL